MLQPLAVVSDGDLMNSDILRHLGVRVALSVHSSLPNFCWCREDFAFTVPNQYSWLILENRPCICGLSPWLSRLILLDFTCFAFMLVSSPDCCFIPWKRRSFERQSGWPRFLACRLLVSDLQGGCFCCSKDFLARIIFARRCRKLRFADSLWAWSLIKSLVVDRWTVGASMVTSSMDEPLSKCYIISLWMCIILSDQDDGLTHFMSVVGQ